MKLPSKIKVASFDVDPQQTFTPLCPDELPVVGGDEIAGELNAQAEFADYRVVSRDAHSPSAYWIATKESPQLSPVEGYPDIDVRWKPHAMVGTKGFELIPGLKASDYDFQVLKGIEPQKHPYGACYHDFADTESTGVIEFLKNKGVTHVLVGGLATDFCVKKTALQLRAAGFVVILNLAACRGISDGGVEEAIKEMRQAGVLFVKTASELENILDDVNVAKEIIRRRAY